MLGSWYGDVGSPRWVISMTDRQTDGFIYRWNQATQSVIDQKIPSIWPCRSALKLEPVIRSIHSIASASQKILTKRWWDCSLTNLVNRRKLFYIVHYWLYGTFATEAFSCQPTSKRNLPNYSATKVFFVYGKAIISLFLVSRHCPHHFLGCLTKF